MSNFFRKILAFLFDFSKIRFVFFFFFQMSKKLFVGNLSWGTSDEDLRQAFAPYGDIEDAVVLKDRDTGRSRGFGFVTFVNDADAEAAVSAMNEADLGGRNIVVNEARPPEARSQGGGNGGGFRPRRY